MQYVAGGGVYTVFDEVQPSRNVEELACCGVIQKEHDGVHVADDIAAKVVTCHLMKNASVASVE